MQWRRRLTVCALITAVAAASCAEDHERPACRELDLAGCARAAYCVPVSGRRLDEANRCIADEAFGFCADRRQVCNDALGYARDEERRVWQFPSSSAECLPQRLELLTDSVERGWGGWQRCVRVSPMPNQVCSELSTTACATELGCTSIGGLQYDPARQCRSQASVAIGCRQADQPCPPAIVYARSIGAAESFEIVSGCLPAGFERVDYPGDIRAWNVCD